MKNNLNKLSNLKAMRARLLIPFIVASMALGAASCVSPRLLEDERAKSALLSQENAKMKADLNGLEAKSAVQSEEVNAMEKQLQALRTDSLTRGEQLRKYLALNKELSEKQEQLSRINEKLAQNNVDENSRLRTDLTMTQAERDAKARDLANKEAELKERERAAADLKAQLDSREAKIAELTRVLSQKDSVTKALKATVSNALRNFQGSGLTVEERNGKVYVSLSEKLLFASGSRELDARGKQALGDLAAVLRQNPTISVQVEGHTDDVPYKGSAGGIRDNWDLSVLRATTVVKALTESGGLTADRVTASGHGSFVPKVAGTSPEARAANRRTDIILTPQLDELFKVLGN